MSSNEDARNTDAEHALSDIVRELARTPTLRERALAQLQQGGVIPETEEALEAALEEPLFEDRADLNEDAADQLSDLIERAREVIGTPTVSPADEIASLRSGKIHASHEDETPTP